MQSFITFILVLTLTLLVGLDEVFSTFSLGKEALSSGFGVLFDEEALFIPHSKILNTLRSLTLYIINPLHP